MNPKRSLARLLFDLTIRQAYRLIVAVVGGTVLLIGVVMIFTPGPAMLLIPCGLAILAAEFVWAKRLLRRVRVTAKWKLRKRKNATLNPSDSETKIQL